MKRAPVNVSKSLSIRFCLIPVVSLACSENESPRSVILITIDTLRADFLSGAGYSESNSP